MLGKFVVTPTGNNFSSVSTDQALEQSLNRDSKTAGGLIGSSNIEQSRSKWFLTSHLRARMLSTVHEMCGKDNVQSTKHAEDRPSYTEKDERDVQSVINLLRQLNTNPFKTANAVLVNIATGLSPGSGVINQIVTAPQKGAEKSMTFIRERLIQQNVAFHSNLPKTKIPPFSAVSEPTHSKKKKKEMSGKSSLTRLIIMSKDRNFDIRELLKYETGSMPLALFDSDGSFRKTKKSDLMRILVDDYSEGQVNLVECAQSKCIIIDGMVMVQSTPVKNSVTFGDYSDTVLKRITKEGAEYSRVHVVFDVYQESSIKGSERSRRSSTQLAAYHISHRSLKLPKNWQSFLSNIKNKNELVNFLIASWQESDIPENKTLFLSAGQTWKLTSTTQTEIDDLKSNHDEADTALIVYAKAAFRDGYSTVVIRTVDTDVLVLATYHLNNVISDNGQCNLLMLMGMGKHKQFISVNNLVNNMPSLLLSSLLALHTISGCDTTSSLFGISKGKFTARLLEGEFDLTEFGRIDFHPNSIEEITACETLIASCYGNYDSITEARYQMLAIKAPEESKLPPSRNALSYHMQRAAYQTSIWKNADKAIMTVPPPTDHGWTHELQPKTHDPCPRTEMTTVCHCTKDCSSRSCKCRKSMLSCTDACSCSSVTCKNFDALEDDSDGDETDDEYRAIVEESDDGA